MNKTLSNIINEIARHLNFLQKFFQTRLFNLFRCTRNYTILESFNKMLKLISLAWRLNNYSTLRSSKLIPEIEPNSKDSDNWCFIIWVLSKSEQIDLCITKPKRLKAKTEKSYSKHERILVFYYTSFILYEMNMHHNTH